MASPRDSAPAVLRELVGIAARAVLHRLAGGCNLLAGWALLGAPAEKRPALEARAREQEALCDRLRRLLDLALTPELRPEDLEEGEQATAVLFAVLGLGVPEENEKPPLPEMPPALALAGAIWCWCVGPGRTIWQRQDPDCLVLRSPRPLIPPAWWLSRYARSDGLSLRPDRLTLHGGAGRRRREPREAADLAQSANALGTRKPGRGGDGR
ncbi:MAG: hypothetical protein D6702_05010 [Planctomycetota bacterium]|nr:MAG: hypothetical protein D6702_05010 [Planctomycetota bacterium]